MVFVKIFHNNFFKLNSYKKFGNFRSRLDVISNDLILNSWKKSLYLLSNNLKNHSVEKLKAWLHQCEILMTYRIRRGQQVFSRYSRLWNEKILRELLCEFRTQITKDKQTFILAIVGFSVYNWEANRIPLEEMKKHFNAFDYAYVLKDNTIDCESCSKRNNVSHCSFDKTVYYCAGKQRKMYDNWSVFIEKNDLIVWRRPHISGVFEYKVYGSYNDVSGEDFLNVQIDTIYRKSWDTTAIELDVVETDPVSESNSDIIYWEMQWPKLFANRDYVFNRRFLVDCEEKIIVIISQSTEHPQCPEKPNKFRVKDYFSAMVVRAHTELDKPGIEFVLTYYDNPGVNIPNNITSWVAMRAMPDFLTRLREATKHYERFCEKSNHTCICTLDDRSGKRKKKCLKKAAKVVDNKQDESAFGIKKTEIEKKIANVSSQLDDIKDDIKKTVDKLKAEFQKEGDKGEEASGDYFDTNVERVKDIPTKLRKQNVKKEVVKDNDQLTNVKKGDDQKADDKKVDSKPKNKNEEALDVILSPSPIIEINKERSFWRYFYPYYYFS